MSAAARIKRTATMMRHNRIAQIQIARIGDCTDHGAADRTGLHRAQSGNCRPPRQIAAPRPRLCQRAAHRTVTGIGAAPATSKVAAKPRSLSCGMFFSLYQTDTLTRHRGMPVPLPKGRFRIETFLGHN